MRSPCTTLLGALLCSTLFLAGCGGDKPVVRTYQMGDKIYLGHLVYTVFETQWLTQIGQPPDARIPQQRFLLIRMNVVNSGGGPVISPHVVLEDSKGNKFEEISNGDGVPQWIGYLREVKPAESAMGNLLFDAPPARYQLRLADEEEARFALVELPLSFAAETPDMPLPGAAKKGDDVPVTPPRKP
jgi:hypothetical protein